MRRRLPLILAVAAVAAVAVAAIAWAQQVVEGPGRFSVDGNRILDPDGNQFTVKGVVAPYGTFAGGNPEGLADRNEDRAPQDYARMRELGVNTVKIYVTPFRMLDAASQERLDRVVRAAREEGLLVILTGFWGQPEPTRRWLHDMATLYRDDPWVWLLPMNEPGCTGPDTSACRDWDQWQVDWRSYIRTIRTAGMESPIVVNAPGWSWNLEQVGAHPLGDDQLVLGAHRYANDATSFDEKQQAEVERMWAGLARTKPVVLDELGNYDGSQFANSSAWTKGMVDFAARWVNEDHGAGVVAFNWRWSDPNSMTQYGGGLTRWGRTYLDGYLRQVDR